MVKPCSSRTTCPWESTLGSVSRSANRFIKIDNMEDQNGIKDCFGNAGLN